MDVFSLFLYCVVYPGLARKSGYRSRLLIIAEILSYINETGETRKTRILYASNLNTRSLMKFLEYLKDIGAVNERVDDEGNLWYSLTLKGRRLLEMINAVYEYLESTDPLSNGYLEKAVRAVRDKWGDRVLSVYTTRITGKSQMDYQVEVLHGGKNDYAVVFMSRRSYHNRSVCIGLLLLLDTELKAVIFVEDPVMKSIVEDLLTSSNISSERFVIIE